MSESTIRPRPSIGLLAALAACAAVPSSIPRKSVNSNTSRSLTVELTSPTPKNGNSYADIARRERAEAKRHRKRARNLGLPHGDTP